MMYCIVLYKNITILINSWGMKRVELGLEIFWFEFIIEIKKIRKIIIFYHIDNLNLVKNYHILNDFINFNNLLKQYL